MLNTNSAKPSQPMDVFFARADVRAQQAIQKRNRYGSAPHKAAHLELKRLATLVGAGAFVGAYE